LLDLRRQYVGIRDEVLAAIARVCDSQSFILGPEVEALEREIAALTGAVDAVGCSSGTEALWLALVAAGVKPGDSVITTAFSFFASASAIVRAGATPIFVDVEPGTLNLDPALVERRLRAQPSENLRAVLPVHLYGQCADMDAFDRIAQEFGVAIVEDAAQAIGAAWNGRGAGSLGKAAAFSFYPTKNLSAYGDAGIVTTTSPSMAEHMRQLRNHGSPRRYYHHEFGWNGRMDGIQAAVLRVKLDHIANWNRSRQQHAATYDHLFAATGLTSTQDASSAPVRLLALVFSPRVADARIREALALAIDRSAMHNVLLQRQGEISGALLPQWLSGYAFLFPTAADLGRARQLAGGARPMALGVSDPALRPIAERIALNARDATLRVSVTAQPENTDARLVELRIASSEPAKALAGLAAALGLPEPGRADTPEQAYTAERGMLEGFRVIPLIHLPDVYGVAAGVKGAPGVTPLGEWRFENLWLDGSRP